MNLDRVHQNPIIAVTIALLFVFATAGTVAAAPPGLGGGGSLHAQLPEADRTTFSGNVYDNVGPLAGVSVEIWDADGILVSTVTDGKGDWTLSPPGLGGGGSLYIRLNETPDSVGGYVNADSLGLRGLNVEWWIEGEEAATRDTTDADGGYAMTCPPGLGGGGSR